MKYLGTKVRAPVFLPLEYFRREVAIVNLEDEGASHGGIGEDESICEEDDSRPESSQSTSSVKRAAALAAMAALGRGSSALSTPPRSASRPSTMGNTNSEVQVANVAVSNEATTDEVSQALQESLKEAEQTTPP